MSKRAYETTTTCFGCIHNKAGQRQHMGVGGCLAEEEEDEVEWDEDDSRELEELFGFCSSATPFVAE